MFNLSFNLKMQPCINDSSCTISQFSSIFPSLCYNVFLTPFGILILFWSQDYVFLLNSSRFLSVNVHFFSFFFFSSSQCFAYFSYFFHCFIFLYFFILIITNFIPSIFFFILLIVFAVFIILIFLFLLIIFYLARVHRQTG